MNKITGAYDLTDITEKQLSTLCDTLSEFSVNSYDMETNILNSNNFFGENIVNLVTSIGDKLDELSMNTYALGISILDSYTTGNENLMNLVNSNFGFLFSVLQDKSQEEKLLASVNQINDSITMSQRFAEALDMKMDSLVLSVNFSAMAIESLMVAFNPLEKLDTIITELSTGLENINSNLQTLVILNALAEKLLENISSQVTIQATLSGTSSGDSGKSDIVVDTASSIGTDMLFEGATILAGIEVASGGAATPLVLLGGLMLGATAVYNYAMDGVESNKQKAAYEDATASSNIFDKKMSDNVALYLDPILTDQTARANLYNNILSDLSGASHFTEGTPTDKINWPNNETTNYGDQNTVGSNEDDSPVGYSRNSNEIQLNSDELKQLSSSCTEKIKIINNSLTPTININMEVQEVFDKDKLIQQINDALKEEIKFAPEGEYEG